MTLKWPKYCFFVLVGLLLITGLTAFIWKGTSVRNINNFDAQAFKAQGFTVEELYLFCDVAFGHEGQLLRKWDTDIKVQIVNIDKLDRSSITDVDSAIAVFAPLIAPLKIERVYNGGNLLIYKDMPKIQSDDTGGRHANGLAIVERPSIYSWSIESARIYDCRRSHTHTLMHELEHALGLEHPKTSYRQYLTIGRSAIPQHFNSWNEWAECMSQPFYLSEQEKTVIRMIYSPQIKSGMSKENFIHQMGITVNEIKY